MTEIHMNTRFVAWAAFVILVQAMAGCDRSSNPVSATPATPTPPPAPQPPIVALAGSYFVTFEADRSCEQLPERFKTRTYEAYISYQGGGTMGTAAWFHAYLQGARFVDVQGWGQYFMIKVTDDFVHFDFSDSFIVEKLEPGAYLTIAGGKGGVTVDPSNLSIISAPFEGFFRYCVTNSDLKFPGCTADATMDSLCGSHNSRWTLTRR
jgi:hypothetical protein